MLFGDDGGRIEGFGGGLGGLGCVVGFSGCWRGTGTKGRMGLGSKRQVWMCVRKRKRKGIFGSWGKIQEVTVVVSVVSVGAEDIKSDMRASGGFHEWWSGSGGGGWRRCIIIGVVVAGCLSFAVHRAVVSSSEEQYSVVSTEHY